MKSKISLFATFLTFLALLPKSGYAEWDINTAYRLAVASKCSYAVKDGRKSVRACFSEYIKNAGIEGSEVLAVFKDIPEESIEVFMTNSGLSDSKVVETVASAVDNLAGKQGEDINAVILARIGDDVIIAFRGTNPTVQDWMNNILFASINNVSDSAKKLTLNKLYKEGRHYGFDESLQSLTKEIFTKSNNWKFLAGNSEKGTLYLTGHSKGGALATGAAVDFAKIFKGNVVTYTFEAARFFTAEGVKKNRSELDNIWRFEYQYDIVPHVPLGKVTYDFMLEHEHLIWELSRILGEPNDSIRIKEWIEKVKENNINFIPAGELAYVDSRNELLTYSGSGNQPDETNREYYRDRFKDSLKMTALMTVHAGIFKRDMKQFVLDQHNECFHNYLKIRINKESLSKLPKYCIH